MATGRYSSTDEASLEFIYLRDRLKKKKKSSSVFGSAGKRTQAQVDACNNYASELMASLPPNAIVAATDGACLGNPGPAGAGAYIYYPHKPNPIINNYEQEISVALGKGTNNKGELWGIGSTLETIINNPPYLPNNARTELHILVDSSFCIGILVKKWTIQSHADIINNLFILQAQLPPNIIPIYHWVPGHVDLNINIQADLLASMGAKKSKNGRGLPPDTVKDLIKACKFIPNV